MASGILKEYIGRGPVASRPATPDVGAGVGAFWWDPTTSKLSCWDSVGGWQEIVGGGGGGGGTPGHAWVWASDSLMDPTSLSCVVVGDLPVGDFDRAFKMPDLGN